MKQAATVGIRGSGKEDGSRASGNDLSRACSARKSRCVRTVLIAEADWSMRWGGSDGVSDCRPGPSTGFGWGRLCLVSSRVHTTGYLEKKEQESEGE